MKYFNWNDAKNKELIGKRNISFEEIVFFIMNDGLPDIIENPNNAKYPGQMILVVRAEDYVYLVPFVEDDETIFLKTIIPSRKMTKKYLDGKMKLNKEEKDLLKSVESGRWKSIRNKAGAFKKYKEFAKAAFSKDKRINIRISSKVLAEIQKKAIQEGLPYQTLISSVLHKYVYGRLKEKSL